MIVLMAMLVSAATPLAPVPYQPLKDARIRTIAYTPERVIAVPVSLGVVTRIVLEPGERIVAAATGIPAKCDTAGLRWCILADADAAEIWVKPLPGAMRNNLELKTNRRDYSFELIAGSTVTYRVILNYAQTANAADAKAGEPALVAERLASFQPVMKNARYTWKSNRYGKAIRPAAVFDDGRFTYFRFPGNSDLPTLFVVGADGVEVRTNFTMQGDYVVVQRLGQKFVLRLGKSVVSVRNTHFDPVGDAPADGATVPGLIRETKGGDHAG